MDVTSLESQGGWRELLGGAGVRSANVSGSGVFVDSATDDRARQIFFAGTVETFQVIIPDFGIVEGPFQITAIEYAGSYNGEATYELRRLGRRADLHGDLMVNPWAGEVGLRLDGKRHVVKLTLGSLAELEAGLGTGTLIELVERFEAGRFSARDVLMLIVAGLRGGGWEGTADDLLRVEIGGGPVEAARVAAELLARAFTVPEGG